MKIVKVVLFVSFIMLLAGGSSYFIHKNNYYSSLSSSQIDSDKQFSQTSVSDISSSEDIDDIDDDDNFDSLIKEFSFLSAFISLFFIFDQLLDLFAAFKNKFAIYLQLLTSLSFLKVFRV